MTKKTQNTHFLPEPEPGEEADRGEPDMVCVFDLGDDATEPKLLMRGDMHRECVTTVVSNLGGLAAGESVFCAVETGSLGKSLLYALCTTESIDT